MIVCARGYIVGVLITLNSPDQMLFFPLKVSPFDKDFICIHQLFKIQV